VLAHPATSSRQQAAGRFRIAASLHITTETAVLLRNAAGRRREVALCASNPLLHRTTAGAALVADDGVSVFVAREDLPTYEQHLTAVLAPTRTSWSTMALT